MKFIDPSSGSTTQRYGESGFAAGLSPLSRPRIA
jgi:hypothetical protein